MKLSSHEREDAAQRSTTAWSLRQGWPDTSMEAGAYEQGHLAGSAWAQDRSLTADDITDEMVERGRSAYWGPTYGGNVNERVRAILTAALTEPPARPEGAEDWEDWLTEAMPHETMPDEDIALLADRIAQRLNGERS